MFDYFYFRLFNYYAKVYTKHGHSWNESFFMDNATTALSALQGMGLFCIIMSLRIFKFFDCIFTDVGAPIIFGAWFVFIFPFILSNFLRWVIG